MLRQLFGRRVATLGTARRSTPKLNILNLEDRSVPAAFTAGNLAIFQAASSSSNNTTASIIELDTTTANQTPSNIIPIVETGANAMRFSGSATSTGYLSLSNDRTLLTFTGANTASTSGNINTFATRAVGTLDSTGAFNLQTTYTGVSGQQTRSATSLDNSTWWIADQSGLFTNGATSPSPTANLRSIRSFGGSVYGFQQSGTTTTLAVGTISAATGGTITGLSGLTNLSDGQDFYLVSSGDNGSAYDVLYITRATSTTAGTINKYSLVSGTWTANGTYTTDFGGFGLAAADSGNGAVLYVSTGTGAAAANRVLKLTDTAGYNTAININTASNVTLYTSPTGTTVKGVAFAPVSGGGSNSAPTLSGANNLAAINEDPTTNAGTTVTDLIAGRITDTDSGAVKGIAITGTVTTFGTWEYTTNGGGTWTAVGTVSESSALLLADNANTSVRFVPNPDYNGTVTNGLTFRAWDQTSGGAGNKVDTTTNGGTTAFSTAQASSSITIDPVNDAPVNTVPGAQTVPIGMPFTFSGANVVSIADSDAGSAEVQVALTVDGGTLNLSGTTGLTFGSGANGTAAMTFTGTIANINAALNSMVFNAPVAPANVTFTITTNDQGNTGGGAETDSDTVAFNVTDQQNQAPVNTVPVAQTTNEEATLTFSSGNGNLISISDADAGTNSVRVTLTAVGGTLTLSGTSGLTFSTGDGTSDATMTFTGTIASINTALAGMNYIPTQDFTGAGSVQIVTDDLGNTGLGGAKTDDDTVVVNVTPLNDAPVNSVPLPFNTVINGVMPFTGYRAISVSDVDAGTADIQVTVGIDAGTLSLGSTSGLVFSVGDGSADTTMTFTGSLANVNAALATLVYNTPTSNASATLTVTTNDQGNTGTDGAKSDTDTVAIGVFDLPVISEVFFNPPDTDASKEYVEVRGTPGATIPSGVYLVGIEGDAGNPGDLQAIFNLSGLTIGSNGFLVLLQSGNTYTVDSNATAITSTNTNFTGLPGGIYSGDNSDIEAVSTTFMMIQTGTAPTLTNDIDSDNDGVADGSVYAGWTVIDSIAVHDGGSGDPVYAPLAIATNGIALAPAKVPVINAGTGTLNYVGRTSDNIGVGPNDWVAGATTGTLPNFTLVGGQTAPAAFGGDALNHVGSSNFPGGAVNHGPTNTVPTGPILINEDQPITLTTPNRFSISDPDSGTTDVQVTLTATNGTVSLSGVVGLSFTAGDGVSDATMTFRGTTTAINTALNNMVFTPAENFAGTASLQMVTDDLGNSGSGGALTDSDSVDFTVSANNDAPQGTDKTATIFVDTTYTFGVADFGFSDPNDTPANALFAVKITTLPMHGTLTLDGVAVNAGDFISVADITGNKLVYTPAAAGVGFPYTSFTFQVQDDGLTLNGGQDTDQSPNTFTFNVRTPNQAPQGTDKTIDILEDSTYTITVADFGFTDPNGLPTHAFASVIIATIPSTGELKNDGIAVTVGQEIPLADIIGGQLTFKPSPNATGTGYANFTFQVRDDGDTTNGGVNLDPTPNTMTFNVTAVDDAPNGSDVTVATNQDVDYVFGAADFAVTDVLDNPAPQGLAGITVVTLPALGTLTVNGSPVTAGQFITLANLINGEFKFTPATGGSGSPYTTFTFQVRDLGSTANGGQVDDPTANTVTIDVIVPNVAPVLSAIFPRLSPVARNTVGGSGQTVASFVGSSITDGDVGALQGIAVVDADTPPAEGVWQFSTDNGTTWNPLTTASTTAAILLRATDLVRFVPAAGFLGQVYLTYHAWDQFSGIAGGTANLTGNTGGSTAFSVDNDVAALDVALPLTNVPEDSRAPTASNVSTLITGFVIDPDLKAKKGVAIIGTTGSEFGTWQYFAGRWKPVVVPQGGALLLSDASKIRFLPFANVTGTATFTYHAWDQTSGRSGTIDPSFGLNPTGGGSAYSAKSLVAMLQVTPVNDAPVLDITGNPPFTSVTPGNNNPAGDLVSKILGTMVTDIEGDTIQMAVVGTTGTGTWQFKRGVNDWANFRTTPRISTKDPLFLELTDLVRFVPAPNFNGTAKLTYKVFDGTSFSRASETGSVLVSPFVAGPPNNAPVLNITPTPAIALAAEDSKPAGSTVASLLGTAFADADIGSKRGIAITGFTGSTNGVWQYSVNGGKAWKPVGMASTSFALLLRETDKVRFLPNKDFNGTATISYHAWDQTRGGVGQRADLTVLNGTGGNSPFSAAEETATATITAINDAPVLDTRPNPVLTSVLPTDTDPTGNTVQSIIGTAGFDVEGDTIQMAVIGKTGTGLWQFQRDGQTTWTTMTSVTLTAPQLLNPADKIRYVPSGFVGVAKLTFKLSDGLLLSKATETASIVVNNVDDRPVLNPRIRPVLNPVLTGDNDPDGTAVASMLAGAVTDADANAQLGIAVTFADEKNGIWQFSTDNGTTWQEIDNASVKTPVFIAPNALVRFKPNATFIGTARLSYKAWDFASQTANGPLALSAAIATATVTVNTAPTLL